MVPWAIAGFMVAGIVLTAVKKYTAATVCFLAGGALGAYLIIVSIG